MADEPLRYCRDESTAAEARRAALATIIGTASAGALSVALFLVVLRFPAFGAKYAQIAESLGFPNTAKKLPWGFWGFLTVSLGISLVFYKSRVVRRWDFLLFSPFDSETLEPVTRYTGLLGWHMPEEGPTRDAWNALRSWALMGIAELDVQAFRRRESGRRTQDPFSWTILLGPNGSGKSQLTKELGRDLGQRAILGDGVPRPGAPGRRRLRLRQWWHRVRGKTLENVPWDAGMVAKRGDRKDDHRLERLKTWLPRAPTFLILDDPPLTVCSKVIETLAARQDKYLFPVRLVIVDQFIPADLPVMKNTDRVGWHHSDAASVAFSPIFLAAPAFDVERFRKVLAQGYWVKEAKAPPILERDLPALYRYEDMERLVSAVDGSPMLLALATHWLRRRGRSVEMLLRGTLDIVAEEEKVFFGPTGEDLRALVSHRLVTERIEELYEGFKAVDLHQPHDKAALRKSIACATIADGISSRTARERFKLGGDDTDLHRVFADVPGTIETVPPVRPWLIGEHFVSKVEHDVYPGQTQGVDGLIREAWQIHPDGTLEALSRPGPLACRIARVIGDAPRPTDGATQLTQFTALAQHALFSSGDSLPRALAIAAEMSSLVVGEASAILERLTELNLRADGLSACALFCSLAARRLETEKVAGEELFSRIQTLLRRAPDGILHEDAAPQINALETAFRAIARRLAERLAPVETIEEVEVRLLQFNKSILRYLPKSLIRHWAEALAENARQPVSQAERFEMESILAFSLAAAETGDADTCETNVKRIERLLASWTFEPSIAARIRATAQRHVVTAHAEGPDGGTAAGLAISVLDEIVRPWPEHPDVQRELAKAWRNTAVSYSNIPNNPAKTELAAIMVDAIAGRFPWDQEIQQTRARTWSAVAYARSQVSLPKASSVEAAALVVDSIGPIPPQDDWSVAEQTDAWASVGYAATEDESLTPSEARASAEHAARKVDEIARDRLREYWLQCHRADAWTFVSATRSRHRDPDGALTTSAATEVVSSIAQLFPSSTGIQTALVGALGAVVEEGSRFGNGPRAEAAARAAENVARRFPDHLPMQHQRANAWTSLVEARAHNPQKRPNAVSVATVVDRIAAPFPTAAKIQLERAKTWRLVVYARAHLADQRSQVESTARLVDAICEPFAESAEFQLERAQAWCTVAFASSFESNPMALLDTATKTVDAIVERFPNHSKLLRERAETWRWAAVALSEVKGMENAVAVVDTIAAQLPDDPFMQLERALAWQRMAYARLHKTDQLALTEAAVVVVDTIGQNFPQVEAIQDARAEAWKMAAEAGRRSGNQAAEMRAMQRLFEANARFTSANVDTSSPPASAARSKK